MYPAYTCIHLHTAAYTNNRDRGVLLQLGQEQVGHLPLGLFDDTLSKPAPALPPP